MIPKRGQYKGQSYKLFDDYNDIHLFVEDAGFENLYISLFNKHGVRLENVFSKNGKESIVRAAKACKDTKCVYLVDRDWDDFLNKLLPLKNLVYLDRYSIENYLVDYDSLVGIIVSENPKCNIDAVFKRRDFDNIIVDVSSKLKSLFECFLSMQLEEDKQKGCSIKPSEFQRKDITCSPDIELIDKFVIDSNLLISAPVKEYFNESHPLNVGHGKYLLYFVWQGVRDKTKVVKINNDKLMVRLAQLLATEEIKTLIDKILSIKGVAK
jgi:hypothetical protein